MADPKKIIEHNEIKSLLKDYDVSAQTGASKKSKDRDC